MCVWGRMRLRLWQKAEGRRRSRRRETLDPALNSIEGERSQFGLAAEGILEPLVKSVANISLLSLPGLDRKLLWALIRAPNICYRRGDRKRLLGHFFLSVFVRKKKRLTQNRFIKKSENNRQERRKMTEEIWASEAWGRVPTLKKRSLNWPKASGRLLNPLKRCESAHIPPRGGT